MKLFTFCGTRKCTLHLALGGAFRGATEPGYKCENIIDFNYNLVFCVCVIMFLVSTISRARNLIRVVYCN